MIDETPDASEANRGQSVRKRLRAFVLRLDDDITVPIHQAEAAALHEGKQHLLESTYRQHRHAQC